MDQTLGHRQAILTLLKSRDFFRLYILGLLLIYCTLFYYFGELVDLAGWDALRWEFFYGVHDVHRLLFLAPIIYAGYYFGVRATIIITIISINISLPRALFISPFPDPTARMLISSVISGALGYLTARVRSETERRGRLETLSRSQRNTMLAILERMDEGILITGPDYRVRFTNPGLIRDFGEGVGTYCYQYLYQLDSPCPQICKLPEAIKGKIEKWEYTFPDGRAYEILASPYIDSDGVVCQLAAFRNITPLKKAKSQPADTSP